MKGRIFPAFLFQFNSAYPANYLILGLKGIDTIQPDKQ